MGRKAAVRVVQLLERVCRAAYVDKSTTEQNLQGWIIRIVAGGRLGEAQEGKPVLGRPRIDPVDRSAPQGFRIKSPGSRRRR